MPGLDLHGWDRPAVPEPGIPPVRVGDYVRLLQGLPVDVDHPLAFLDGVAGQPDDPLDEILVAGALNPSPSVTQWKNPEIGLRWVGGKGFGSENTMTSPRLGGLNLYASLLTSTRSPTSSMGSIEPDGM